ncbi:hypothetical protein J6590_106067 [Homalodisca vitripennis]|nr:hypothetical protein J6590_106067 [Homalodisca vitripennis]
MSDCDSDSESVATAQNKKNPRISWIYQLKKDELIEELKKFRLPSADTVKEPRKILSQFLKGEYQLNITPAPRVNYPSTSEQNSSSLPSSDSTSICNMVRKWNLNYDGDRDVMLFLERLNELKEAYNTNSEHLLVALPELLGNLLRRGRTFGRGYNDHHGTQLNPTQRSIFNGENNEEEAKRQEAADQKSEAAGERKKWESVTKCLSPQVVTGERQYLVVEDRKR